MLSKSVSIGMTFLRARSHVKKQEHIRARNLYMFAVPTNE
jgi:hypothetical protein